MNGPVTSRDELNAKCRELGELVGAQLTSGVGFALLIFDFGTGGNLAWISNADRAEMLNTLKEFIVKVELDQAGERRS